MNLKPEEMTLEQKIGMVLCLRNFDDEDMDFILELVKKRALGSAQPSSRRKEQLKRILDAADYPIIIVDDMEQGFSDSDLPKIPLNALAACNKPEYCHAFAKGVVRDAKAAGYNGNWGPVIDILECNGPCKVSRVFSDNADRVGKLAEEISKIFHQNHFFACGKHFPGSSGIAVDTHMREGVSEFTRDYIMENNLKPYKHLLEKNLLHTVMVGHTVYKNIDPDYPASLSKKVIDMLREIGFDGVLFTDSFAMMAILQKFGEENIYGMAINAGIDIILPNYRTSIKDCYNMLMQNYKDGVFTEERLNEAIRRVLALQEFVGQEPANPTVFTAEDEELLNNVARDCVTAVTDDGVSASLTDKDEKKLFVIMTQMDSDKEAEIPEISTAQWYDPQQIANRIKVNFPESTIKYLPEFPAWSDNEQVLNASTAFKEVVIITYCNTTCYQGTDGLTRRAEACINSLIASGKVSALVHFGNPFALEELDHVERRIFGYTLSKSQEYAIDVLAGKIEAKGTIPFAVNLK